MKEKTKRDLGIYTTVQTRLRHQDGGWGWVVVMAAFFLSLLTDGIIFSFGVLFIELVSSFNRGRAETAWIGSLVMCTSHLFGPVNSIAINWFGTRKITIAGSIIACLGLVCSFFVTEMYQLYISFGVITGYGFGMMYMSGSVSVMRYFDKRRSLASGLASCGSGAGSFLFSPLSKLLIELYGWRGTFLIQGALVLNGVFFGSLLRPIEVQPKLIRSPSNLETGAVQETNTSDICDTSPDGRSTISDSDNQPPLPNTNTGTITIESSPLENETLLSKMDQTDKVDSSQDKQQLEDETICVEIITDKYPEPRSKNRPRLLNIDLLRNPLCGLYMLSGFCINLGFTVPINLLPDWAVERGFSLDEAVWLVSALAICNTGCRCILGYLADKFLLNRVVLFRIIVMLVGIVTLLSPLCTSYWMMMTYACLYGCLIGGLVMLFPVVLTDVFGADIIADVFGLFFAAAGVGGLVSTPIGGWIFDRTGNYNISFMVAGVEFVIGGAILFLPDIIKCLKSKSVNQRVSKVDL